MTVKDIPAVDRALKKEEASSAGVRRIKAVIGNM